MLDDAGRIDFTPELLDLVERLWCHYTHTLAPDATATERLAGLLYAAAALRQDAETLERSLAAEPDLVAANASTALTEALGAVPQESLSALRIELQRRGWV
jgi:hypothetical protein